MKLLNIGIVAGEASGDFLAASLMRAIKNQYPNVSFQGVAGPKMKAEGCQELFDIDELSVMGFLEVFKRIFRIYYVRQSLIKTFVNSKIDFFIGVDASDFNISLAHQLKKRGIYTVQFKSPSVWAWRQWRIHKITKAMDLMLTLFPFENQIYIDHNIPVTFVGHPMADDIPLENNQSEARAQLGAPPEATIIGLLPGSRKQELHYLAKRFIETAQQCLQKRDDLYFLIPLINQKRREQFETILRETAPDLPIKLIDCHSHEVMQASDALLIASGTATLEAMLLKRPMVIAYRYPKLYQPFTKRFLRVKHIGLPNLLANERLVPEFLQDEATPENLSAALLQCLEDKNNSAIEKFTQLHQTLRKNASETAAKAILKNRTTKR